MISQSRARRCTPFLAFIAAAVLAATSVAAPKLTPNQREAMKRAEYHLAEAERKLPDIESAIEQLKGTKETVEVNYAPLMTMIAAIADVRQRLTNVNNALEQVPADHEPAAAVRTKVQKHTANLDAYEALCIDTRTKLDELRDIKHYPDFAADLEKMRTLGKAYKFNSRFIDRPDDVEALWSQSEANLQWYKQVFEKYQPIMRQRTAEGVTLHAAITDFAKSFKAFRDEAQQSVNDANAAFAQSLSEADAMAKKAAAEKRPAFFEGGVQQQMDLAVKNLRLFAVFAGRTHPKYLAMKKEHDDTKQRIAQVMAQLNDEIIAATPTPADVYRGDDKSQLKQLIEQTWASKYPNDKLLGVHFHMQNWKRDAGFSWNSGSSSWREYDDSLLVASVVVKSDARLATIYPVYVNRDNLAKSTVIGADTKGDGYVIRQMLLANYRP